jgi:hypothetical protein
MRIIGRQKDGSPVRSGAQFRHFSTCRSRVPARHRPLGFQAPQLQRQQRPPLSRRGGGPRYLGLVGQRAHRKAGSAGNPDELLGGFEDPRPPLPHLPVAQPFWMF